MGRRIGVLLLILGASVISHNGISPARAETIIVDNELTESESDAILAWVELPREARPGEAITLTIVIENARETTPFFLESIDIDWSFTQVGSVRSVSPKPKEVDDSLGSLDLVYEIEIAAGESRSFTVEMTVEGLGVFIGEVNIWSDEESVYRFVQLKVVDRSRLNRQ